MAGGQTGADTLGSHATKTADTSLPSAAFSVTIAAAIGPSADPRARLAVGIPACTKIRTIANLAHLTGDIHQASAAAGLWMASSVQTDLTQRADPGRATALILRLILIQGHIAPNLGGHTCVIRGERRVRLFGARGIQEQSQ